MHKGVADNEYEIESILYDDAFGNKTMYMVKWKNYPLEQCTWEPYRNLTNCQQILNNYRSNRIVVKDVRKTDKFKKMRDMLSIHTEEELIKTFQAVVRDGIPVIDEDYVNGFISYLTTISSSNRDASFVDFIRHNLMLLKIKKIRHKQQYELEKWQKSMNAVCGFNITVVNNIDFEGPPNNFSYVDECVAGEGVTIPNDPPVWCHCDVTCGGRKRKKKDCHFNDFPAAYNKLRRVIVPQGTPIYECNKKCLCNSTCVNRVVQHGPNKNMKLQIFRTHNNRGWGVKTLTSIKQGSYVTKYTGEVITREEADARGKSTYVFDLDYNTDINDSVYSVDATSYGNVSHFINHSCEANLVIYAVWIDCYDTNLPTLALFASRDINVGEEITFNYMASAYNEENSESNRTVSSGAIACLCESSSCRKFLW